MGNKTLLAVNGLNFRYVSRTPYVLRGVSLRIHENEVVSILGPNGSGKTTLLKILSRVVEGYEGEVEVFGRSLLSYSLRDYAKLVAYVPQEEHVPFPFTVSEYVLLGRTPHMGLLALSQEDLLKVQEAIARVGLHKISLKKVIELSGGERQLARIARALAQEPVILLLDEPTSHLDISNKVKILKLIRGFSRDKGSVLFTTHDPNEALLTADSVYIMSSGTVVAEGSPKDVIHSDIVKRTYGAEVLEVNVSGHKIIAPTLPD